MTDLIDRQAAIEIIQSMYPGMPRIPWMRKDWQKRYEPYIRTENAIRELPSVQPEMDEWCETCKEYDSEKHCCPRWNRVIREAVKQTEIIRCRDCKHSEHWYRDKCRCFLWVEYGIDVFDDGFCNYAERRTDEMQ